MLPLSTTLFRILNVLPLVLVGLGAAVDPYFMRQLHVAHSGYASYTNVTAYAVVGLLGLTLDVTSTVGLHMFRPWARPLALVGAAKSIALYPLCSYFAVSGVTTAIDYAAITVGGAVLAMAYFSPIALRFAPNNASQHTVPDKPPGPCDGARAARRGR